MQNPANHFDKYSTPLMYPDGIKTRRNIWENAAVLEYELLYDACKTGNVPVFYSKDLT